MFVSCGGLILWTDSSCEDLGNCDERWRRDLGNGLDRVISGVLGDEGAKIYRCILGTSSPPRNIRVCIYRQYKVF